MGNFAPGPRQLEVMRIINAHGGTTDGISTPKIAAIMGVSPSTVHVKLIDGCEKGWFEVARAAGESYHKYGLTAKARAYLEMSEGDMAGKKAQLVWRLCALCSAITQEIGDRSPVSAGSTSACEYAEATRKEIRRRIGCELGIDEASLKAMAAPFYCKGETLDFGDPQVGDKFWEIYAKLGGRRAGRS